MAFEMEVISKSVITPSSPTPDHLKKLNLSYIDQFSPSLLLAVVYFYPASNSSNSSEERLKQLKKSLSKALTQFYPLAGRIDIDNNSSNYINCNDKGVIFVEARANSNLLDVVNNPINMFLPVEFDDSKDVCMIVQAICFNCGGLAIGVAITHKLVDACSLLMFVNSWTDISRRDEDITSPPQFNSAILFPPRDLGGFDVDVEVAMETKEDIVTKRFHLTASNIAALRDKYTKDGSPSPSPSRIVALSAFIGTRFMISTQAKNDYASKIYPLVNVVNLRTRADPPFPDCYFGNMFWPAIAVPPTPIGDEKETSFVIAEKVRESIHAIDADYVKKLQEGNEQLNVMKNTAKDTIKGQMVPFIFSSFCRFPVYGADFGWGKPMLVGTDSHGFKNCVIFVDSLSGDCIDAWINLNLKDMAKFEADEELLSYVSSGHDASFSTM